MPRRKPCKKTSPFSFSCMEIELMLKDDSFVVVYHSLKIEEGGQE